MGHRVDKRTIHGERDDSAVSRLRELARPWRELTYELARLFARIDRKEAYHFESASSVADLAERLGYDRREASRLMHMGHALEGEPGLERALETGDVTPSKAQLIGQIHRSPDLKRSGDSWLDWARSSRYRDLQCRVRERREQVRQETDHVTSLTISLSSRAKARWDRCWDIASQRAGRLLTYGQLQEVLCASYLLDADPLFRPFRRRRMPDTRGLEERRGVPAEVVRAIFARSGGICEFGGCERPGVNLTHLVPHRDGSGREENDLAHGCRLHHKAYDAGWIEFLFWSKEGLPVFTVKRTGEMLLPKPRPEHRRLNWLPRWLILGLGPHGRRSAGRRRAQAIAALRGSGGRSKTPPGLAPPPYHPRRGAPGDPDEEGTEGDNGPRPPPPGGGKPNA